MIKNYHEFFNDSKLNQLLSRQIEQLKPQLVIVEPKHMLTIINFPCETDIYQYVSQSKKIEFVFVITKSYPVHPPRVHLKDAITPISFSDCRDLLFQILREEWNFKLELKDIKQKIPQFLMKLKKSEDVYYFVDLGYFHLNYVYPMSLIKLIHRNQWFAAFQIDQQKLKMMVIVVTPIHFIAFLTTEQPIFDEETQKLKIPHQNDLTTCQLIFYAEVGCISEVICSKENKFTELQILFTTKKTFNMQLTQKPSRWRIKARKGGYLLQKLIRSIKNYEPKQIKLDLNPNIVNEEEARVLVEVAQCEKKIFHKFNQNTIRQLNISYQATVEYYSGKNIPYYQVFMDKISRLNQRPDVRLIMGASPPQQFISKTEQKKKINRTDKMKGKVDEMKEQYKIANKVKKGEEQNKGTIQKINIQSQ